MKITLPIFLELVKYEIVEGGKYLWKCYGDNVWYWDSLGGDGFDYNAGYSIVFDTVTQEVYEVSCYALKDTYVYHNSKYKEAYNQECLDRKVDIDHIEVSYLEMYDLFYHDELQN